MLLKCNSLSEDSASDYPSFLTLVLVLSMVVPYFHLMRGCSVFLFVVMPINCSCAWLGVGLALFPPYEVLALFPRINRARFFLSHFPQKNEVFDQFATLFEYN